MKPGIVWRILAIGAGMLLGTALILDGCAGDRSSTSPGAFQQVGPWRVMVGNSPDPAHVGENALIVAVRDSSGRPMRGGGISRPRFGRRGGSPTTRRTRPT